MKIRITENTKSAFLMSEADCLKVAEETMKESGWISKQDLEIFANFVGTTEILKAEAEYAKNGRIWNRYGEGSGRADVWVRIVGYDRFKTFVIAGAYLSDIWDIGAVDRDELMNRMYIREFKEVE